MILIFDAFGGLCDQFYDINCYVIFCITDYIFGYLKILKSS